MKREKENEKKKNKTTKIEEKRNQNKS